MLKRKKSKLKIRVKSTNNTKLRTRDIAIASVFAALYAAGSFFPGFPIIGISGSIKIMRAFEPSYGLILGPILGPIAALLGAAIGGIVSGGSSTIIFSILAPVATFIASCLGQKRVLKVPGWIIGCSVMAAIICSWFLTETGRAIPYYVIPHVLTLGLALVFRGKAADYIASGERNKTLIGMAVISAPATMSGQALGTIMSILLYQLPPLMLIGALPIAIVERTIITAISTFAGTPIIFAARRFLANTQ